MQEEPRTAPARDVPRPRPVAEAVDDTASPLARAARSVADAVGGLLADRPAGEEPPGKGGRAGAVLRDVVTAVASAARAGRGDGADDAERAPAGEEDRGGGWRPGTVLTDLLHAAAPRLPIRDAARLRAAYPGMDTDAVADALVTRYGRITAGIGAATGGLTAAQWFAPPSMVALPLELGAETVLVAAVEVVLIGELHELHGRPAPGDARARAAAYLTSWTHQRAVDTGDGGGGGLLATLGSAGVNALRRRVTRRLARNVSSAAPMLLGAGLAARSNRKATSQLAEAVLADLRAPGRH
ncbi:hypothetical protein [Klenkia taihuensis]|uniref:EcsC protein family protein n=1 Tax=Klenkia taihuensis TaxID=1225127 RepID=A0A1I1Q9C6_9ACTN|nr:hypothetical protein [Klenkia taihuensis]GHE08039.1 hypothetical protein GCM10011381_07070 [Klenkia taihuensis]SFD18552.1 hypothetical protein SAMN05661030_2664 [Klenkia taihuensis]